MTSELQEAVDRVLAAILDPGPHPRHHYRVWFELQAAWPTLTVALLEMMAVRGREQLRP